MFPISVDIYLGFGHFISLHHERDTLERTKRKIKYEQNSCEKIKQIQYLKNKIEPDYVRGGNCLNN